MANTMASAETYKAKLTAAEIAGKSKTLAEKERERDTKNARKKAMAKKLNSEIKLLAEDISKLAEEVDTGEEDRPVQTDMFGGAENPDGEPFAVDEDDGFEGEAPPAPKKRGRKAKKA